VRGVPERVIESLARLQEAADQLRTQLTRQGRPRPTIRHLAAELDSITAQIEATLERMAHEEATTDPAQ
jgi:hypothetical protein